MTHSKNWEETALWKVYQEKAAAESARADWVKEVCKAAAIYLQDVRQTFQNYTLHDETHIINVLDVIGGLLGDQISNLTEGEAELLILAASLHDLGMVYTKEEQKRHYEDAEACRKFSREYCPEYLGTLAEDWPEDIRQWYLRTLHPFRLPEVLQNQAWKELFDRRPPEAVPRRCLLAVCRAHGEKPEEFSRNRDLEYLAANDADPLFCALLLRLGDLLDFDDTRAPRVLYGYVENNEQSRGEWKKHQASAGFYYPSSPSVDDLPYKACCTNPGVEHAVRDFLNWIDDELGNCIKLQKYCRVGWQQAFPFPRAVLRKEIESEGYMSGDFCLTMDQAQVLKLLTGENLYDNSDVFVRELLQNAIDATLLRGRMEPNFKPEQSRIDIWEWNDKEGNIWFRIDDQGIGMTMGMLQRYFLKVGNSYYTSRELERDLRDHGQTEKYQGISRFGIGFLSCFLCGECAEVSTLYFDSDKNRREEDAPDSYQTVHYGLRLQVTGLSGYYTLKNQARHHQTEGRMPGPEGYDTVLSYEREGYRAKPGTSIALRLDPGKLGALNLREAVETYLCGARVPVYYNNKRIGGTYEEVMQVAHELAGERVYELPRELKEEFDRCFPAVCGRYPRIVMRVVPLDTEEDHVLPGVSGVLAKYEVRFEEAPEWWVKDLKFEVSGEVRLRGEVRTRGGAWQVILHSDCTSAATVAEYKWERLESESGEAAAALGREFEKYSACPQKEQLGEAWTLLEGSINLLEAWEGYHVCQQNAAIGFALESCGCPGTDIITFHFPYDRFQCAYQGVRAGRMVDSYSLDYSNTGLFFLENQWKPVTEVSRFKVTEMPLVLLTYISGVLRKYQMLNNSDYNMSNFVGRRGYSLKDWREARIPELQQWLERNQKSFFEARLQFLKDSRKTGEVDAISKYVANHSDYTILNRYQDAYLQDHYQMVINYEEGQTISFQEKDAGKAEEGLDLFPPMRFCKAASDKSRRYLCGKYSTQRKGITIDHPFMIWLLENSFLLNQYYQRQFRQMIDCLGNDSAEDIIRQCNQIRQQLMSLPEHHGVDVAGFPQLGMDDFWGA